MKALKILVWSMGAVLVIGFGFLIWGLTGRGGAAVSASHAAPRTAAAAALADFGQVTVPLAATAHVEQTQVVDGRLVVTVADGTAKHLLVLDVAGGRVAGEFILTPAHP